MPDPAVAEADFTLYVGAASTVLAGLPDGSVDCIVTSPPYWNLRDYGTGEWDGGDPACDHLEPVTAVSQNAGFNERYGNASGARKQEERARRPYLAVCGLCGALRTDEQLGLEEVHDCGGWVTGAECGACYVCHLVAVLRECRRVLAPHGTLWLNLGDSYASKARGSDLGWETSRLTNPAGVQKAQSASLRANGERHRGKASGLKEKDLAGIPWRVALALQADGWWLRNDNIWTKNNPMPSSTTDRATVSHEYVFMLSRSARYWYDAEAVKENAKDWTVGGPGVGIATTEHYGAGNGGNNGLGDLAARYRAGLVSPGRNARTVWEINTQPYKGAHFATFPEKLVRRALLAGCPREVCTVCGVPRTRIVEKGEPILQADTWSTNGAASYDDAAGGYVDSEASSTLKHVVPTRTVGWTDCGHAAYRPGRVLDPFLGSGTVAVVARQEGRHTIGVELNPAYVPLIEERVAAWHRRPTVAADPDQLSLIE